MKTTFSLFAVLLASSGAFTQSSTNLDLNNANALINNNGTFFNNEQNGTAGYEIPKGSLANAIYFMNVAAMGTDVNGQLKGAISGFNYSDFTPGPIATNYLLPSYLAGYQTSLWSINKSEIDNHIANWNTAGYVLPAAIAEWPGNGNVMNGEAIILAPFFDVNGDEVYDPTQGDYPIIRGDKAVFSILNDRNNAHVSGTEPIGIEVHLLFYQFASADSAVNNTTFINATVINRGTQTLFNMHFGSFIDFELGNYNDDYLGTSIPNNLAYAYNADLNDEDNSGHIGYGLYPPAVGVMTLNKPLYSHVSSNGTNTPNSPTSFYNLLSGTNVDGSAVLDNNGQSTHYLYTSTGDTGWNEYAEMNAAGDRRSMIGFEPTTLLPDGILCYDMAVVYGRSNAGGFFDCVDSLVSVAEHIQNFYDYQEFACAQLVLGTQIMEQPTLMHYPNPATNNLTVSGIDHGNYRIIALDGKVVLTGTLKGAAIDISQLKSGYYVCVYSNDVFEQQLPLIKE